MSADTDRARTILAGAPGPAGTRLPMGYDLQIAACYAAVAQAVALERIATVLEEGVLTVTRVE